MKELLLGWWRCILVVLGVLMPSSAAVNPFDGYQIHTLEKNYNLLRHPKRDPSCQQSGYSLCPASVDGGCCPDGYACAVSSCYATTAGPTTACGKVNWYNCPISAGPGFCCPVGFICKQDCVPASDGEIPASFACPASYFGCPSTLGGGCCPDGMACGSATCYDTHPQTFTVSGPATTTNSRGDKITTTTTETTIITPGPETSTAAAASLIGVPKLIPSTVSKMPAIETGNSSSGDGGLTQAQIGGIVGGAIGLLAIIIIVAAVIMWQLKQTERYAREAESRRETSSGQPRSQKSGFGQPSISEVDGTDVDSIVRARATHNRTRSDSTTAGSRTPDLWGSNASTTPPTWVGWSTRPLASNASDGRQSSMDSYGAHHDNAAYPPRPSVESQGSRKPAHTRQWSDASELDGSAISAHGVSELDALDASDAARRRSNSSTRPPMAQMRRTSDPSGKARAEGGAVAATPLGPLAEVNELHGYYGAPDLAVGQTAARLNHKNSSLSSLPRDEKK